MRVKKILIAGMSGTGKSTALQELEKSGHRVVDTDTDDWSHWITLPDGSTDWVWQEPKIAALLTEHEQGVLFVAAKATHDVGTYWTGRAAFYTEGSTRTTGVRWNSSRTTGGHRWFRSGRFPAATSTSRGSRSTGRSIPQRA
jgi:hypothetical protein